MKKMIVSLALFAALLVPAQGALAKTKKLARAKQAETKELIRPSHQNDVVYDALIARPAAWFHLMVGIVQYVPAATVSWIAGKDTTRLDEELVNNRYHYATKRFSYLTVQNSSSDFVSSLAK